MTDQTGTAPATPTGGYGSDAAIARLKARRRAETRLKAYGISAIALAFAALGALVWSVASKTATALTEHYIVLEFEIPAEDVDPDGTGDVEVIGKANFGGITKDILKARFPSATGRKVRRQLYDIVSSGAAYELRKHVLDNPAALRGPLEFEFVASDVADLYLKGVHGSFVEQPRPPASALEVTELRKNTWQVTADAPVFGSVLGGLSELLLERAARLRSQALLQENGRRVFEERLQAATDDAERAELRKEVAARTARRDQLTAEADALVRTGSGGGGAIELDRSMPSLVLRVGDDWYKLADVQESRATVTALSAAAALPGRLADPDWTFLANHVPESARKTSDLQAVWLEDLRSTGSVEQRFNWRFFTSGDSREPELAGILGAVVGSFWTMLVTFLLAFPVGVLAAVYLEEFAPRNRWTGPHRGQHQQSRRRAVDRVRTSRALRLPRVLRRSPLGAPRRRHNAGADDAADHHHRVTRRDSRGSALDSRRGARNRRIEVADVVSPCAPAGPSRDPDGDNHRHGAGARRDGAADHDRHGGVHRRCPGRHHGQCDGSSSAGVPLVGFPGTRLRGAHGPRDLRAAGISRGNERACGLPPQALRTALVGATGASAMNQLTLTDSELEDQDNKISARDVNVHYGDTHAIKNVDVDIPDKTVTAFIGPSGCGKSTFLRCFNRMNDTIEICRVTGDIRLEDQNIYDRRIDPVQLRARVGMVFQKPNPFPKSVYDNVAYGPRIHGLVNNRSELDEVVEECLKRAALWREVKDRLHEPGTGLSGGQQQRLCIARAVATAPEVLLMDEPCSALDPIATAQIEELIDELRLNYAVVIVTHSMQQAARVSQRTAFFHLGSLVEHGHTTKIFTNPDDQRTQDYITGRFG